MKEMVKQWRHVFKLDPAKEISDENLHILCQSNTDAIIVGGTDNITEDSVLELLYRIRQYALPCVLEVSSLDAICPGFDYYFIPSVLNSKDKKWMMDIHHEALKTYQAMINWDEVLVEGYCILNEDAKAFEKAACSLPTDADVIAYATMAEKMFNLPIFYMEYSGVYGDPELVKRVKSELEETLLVYGGGIETAAQAKEMAKYADMIVVGNSIYSHFEEAVKTVNAIK